MPDASLTPARDQGVDRLEVKDLSKSYAGVRALDRVSTVFRQGLNGIVGDNGAGKSTLMKIISGDVQPDAGQVILNGKGLQLRSTADARKAGIESLYQDLALADTLDVAGNVFLGREITRNVFGLRLLDKRAMVRAARQTVSGINIQIPDVTRMVRTLSGGQRQGVALARAIYFNAPVILLDEPTAALGPRETAAVLEVVGQLRRRGKLIIMVSHNIPQILDMADHLIVMRSGRIVREVDPRTTSQEDLLGFMVGSRV
jgi:ABC-type sugar transport system ATPase subunit